MAVTQRSSRLLAALVEGAAPQVKKAGQLWAVIMAGGSGTRFWPESRQKQPKQFLRIFGKKTLLEETVARLGKVIPPRRVLVVTQKKKETQVRKLFKGVPSKQIMGEPVGRNTAPCAVLAARMVLERDPDAVLALLPADHRIENVGVFTKALEAAARVALQERKPVTFGIQPTFPHTGYGYLELDYLVSDKHGFPVYRLKRFHEKPNLKKATAFFHSRSFLWNSGMFVWRADELLKTAARYLPEAYAVVEKIAKLGFQRGMKRFYHQMPSVSIDYGLMEKIKGNIFAIPVDFGWNDVGGWQSLGDLYPKDKHQNVVLGKALLIDSEGNIVKTNRRLIALLGVKNFVVVDTPDALLVCPKDKTESIRKVVEELKHKKWKQYL